jgi:predicted transposase/invertase (TIGR01784 family)
MKTVPLIEISNALSKEEGILIGMERGIEKGIKQGKFKVARLMLADGLPTETISKFTGLDDNTILTLK